MALRQNNGSLKITKV